MNRSTRCAGLSIIEPAGFSRHRLSGHVGADHRIGFLRSGPGLPRAGACRQSSACRNVFRSAGPHRRGRRILRRDQRSASRANRCRKNAGHSRQPDHVLPSPSRRGRCGEDAGSSAGSQGSHRRRRPRFIGSRPPAEQVQARVQLPARRASFCRRMLARNGRRATSGKRSTCSALDASITVSARWKTRCWSDGWRGTRPR